MRLVSADRDAADAAGTFPDRVAALEPDVVIDLIFGIDKPRALLGYIPQYEPEEAVLESVRWLIEHAQLKVANPVKV